MKHILIYGDSNSWGYDVTRYLPEINADRRMSENERWPGLVRTLLGPGYHVIEDALNGRTAMQEDPYIPNRNGLIGCPGGAGRQRAAGPGGAEAGLQRAEAHVQPHRRHDRLRRRAAGARMRQRRLRLSRTEGAAHLAGAHAPGHRQSDLRVQLRTRCLSQEPRIRASCTAAWPSACGCGFIDCAALDLEINEVDGLHYSRADHAKLAPMVRDKVLEMLAD